MEAPIQVRVKRLESAQGLPLPSYMTEGSSGIDLLAANEELIIIKSHQVALIPTGLIMEIPQGIEGQLRPRSGLALKHGLTLLNSPGTIDSDYRGEIKIIVINLGDKDYSVQRGDRIAQMVFVPVIQVNLQEAEKIDDTNRGAGGFGHTG